MNPQPTHNPVAAESRFKLIQRTVQRIPRGRVATYGQIARVAGLAGQARQVGYALHALSEDSGVPWHRVINAKGEISLRGLADLQQALLEDEGVEFNRHGRVDLERYAWRPRTRTPRPTPRP